MHHLLLYTFKAGLLIATLFMFYRLMLSKETFHRLSRIVLLLIPVVGYLLPAGWITFTRTIELPEVQFPVPEENGAVSDAIKESSSGNLLLTILFSVYVAGVFVVLTKNLLTLLSIRNLIRSSEIFDLQPGVKVAVTRENLSPMSWMNYVIISKEDYLNQMSLPEEQRTILLHECAHIRMGHSWDILYLSLVCAFQWFNPAVWMIRSDLREVHEYMSDASVIRSGVDAKQYQFMLVRKAMSEMGYPLANGFSHSSLTKRINMMLKKRTPLRRAILKTLAFIPLLVVCLVSTAKTRVVYGADPGEENILVLYDGKEISAESYAKIDPSEILLVHMFPSADDGEKLLGHSLPENCEGVMVVFSKKMNGDPSLDKLRETIQSLKGQSLPTEVEDSVNDEELPELIPFRPVPSNAIYLIDGEERDKGYFTKYVDLDKVENLQVVRGKAAVEEKLGRSVSGENPVAVIVSTMKSGKLVVSADIVDIFMQLPGAEIDPQSGEFTIGGEIVKSITVNGKKVELHVD